MGRVPAGGSVEDLGYGDEVFGTRVDPRFASSTTTTSDNANVIKISIA